MGVEGQVEALCLIGNLKYVKTFCKYRGLNFNVDYGKP